MHSFFEHGFRFASKPTRVRPFVLLSATKSAAARDYRINIILARVALASRVDSVRSRLPLCDDDAMSGKTQGWNRPELLGMPLASQQPSLPAASEETARFHTPCQSPITVAAFRAVNS